MFGLLLILAIVGAIYDHTYVSRGGKRTTRTEKIYLLIAVTLSAIALVVLGILGTTAEGLGYATGYLVGIIFCLWELRRLFIRKANPIKPTEPESEQHRH